MAENADIQGPMNMVLRDYYRLYSNSSMQQSVHNSCSNGKTTADIGMPHGALRRCRKDEEEEEKDEEA